MNLLAPLLFLLATNVDAKSNIRRKRTPISAQCLEDMPIVGRIPDLSDGEGNAKYCSPRRFFADVDNFGTTTQIELTICDATGTDDASRIINTCKSAGGKDITVTYVQDCHLAEEVDNRKEIIGPLCIPMSCEGDSYIDYMNKMNEDKLALDFGSAGGCRRTLLSMNEAEL